MTQSPLDRLTPREREALEAYFRHAHRGLAATALGISENTLKTHLISARRKLSMADAQIVDLLFPHRDGPHPMRASPHRVMDAAQSLCPDGRVEPHLAATNTSGPLHDSMRVGERHRSRWEVRRNDLTILHRVVLIAIATMAVVIVLVLAVPFLDGVQRWSNTIATPTKQ